MSAELVGEKTNYPPIDDPHEPDITDYDMLLMFRLNRMEAKLDELIAFKNQAETVFEAMNEAIAGNPMLSMMLGK